MIHQTPIISRVSNAVTEDPGTDLWQKALKNAFRDPVELLNFLGIPTELIDKSKINTISFPMLVPRSFALRMTPGDVNDPLLLQVLPVLNELEQNSNYSFDPVGDLESMKIPGLLHKYQGRVLLTLTGACAIHCRYCFRRHFPYSNATITSSNLKHIITYIRHDNSINEVILSGGDPLSLSDRRLQDVIRHIESINHVKYLRLHSRLPIVLPERITSDLLNCLKESRLTIIFVIHCNHPNEINQLVEQQLHKISNSGIRLLNQSVLLRNINDDVATLANLSRKLFDLNVTPYYLHLLDKVMGAQHFDISRSTAKSLYEALQNCLPGYLVPKLVQELPGKPSKTLYI
ncbi:MAG: EF-P beta-lysylation protein EpmB [Thiohalomonadales bacterium]